LNHKSELLYLGREKPIELWLKKPADSHRLEATQPWQAAPSSRRVQANDRQRRKEMPSWV